MDISNVQNVFSIFELCVLHLTSTFCNSDIGSGKLLGEMTDSVVNWDELTADIMLKHQSSSVR